MSNWLPIAWHAPGWLLLLPLPWLAARAGAAAWRLSRRRIRDGAADGRTGAFADAHLLPWLRIGPASMAAPRIVPLAATLIVLAAAGPYLPRGHEDARRHGIDIAVVVDISPSMAADDVAPTRLARAALELRDFTARLVDDRVALIVYSAYAYRILPLTDDPGLLDYYAGTLDPGLTRRHGSNLAAALEYAAQALDTGRARGRAVVVLSDGETADRAGALAAADRLHAQGIPVFCIGIGTAAGAPVPGPGGYLRNADGIVISHLDGDLLGLIARRTGGIYAGVRTDDRDWDRIGAGLETLRRDAAAPPRPRNGYPLHPLLLAAAFALLLWNGVRRVPAAAALCLLACAGIAVPRAGYAAAWQEQTAYDALRAGDNAAAAARYGTLDGYTGWLGRGAAAYREGNWEQALAAFRTAAARAGDDGDRATALYDQGTTLARLGRYAEAEHALERALELRPDHARARANLALVRRAQAQPPVTPPGSPRLRDGADRTVSASAAAEWDAAAGTATARPETAGRATSASAAQLGEIGALVERRDRPDEILRHRMQVQDVNHPLVAEEQSW